MHANKYVGGTVKIKIMSNQELAKELHKPIIRKFEKQTVCSLFKDSYWGDNTGHMQLIIKCKKGFCFFYYMSLIFSRNTHRLFV